MAHFFFHLDECGTITSDLEGRELPDLEQAKLSAIIDARSIMSSEVSLGRLCMSCHIDIEDDQCRHLAQISFQEALSITGLPPSSAAVTPR